MRPGTWTWLQLEAASSVFVSERPESKQNSQGGMNAKEYFAWFDLLVGPCSFGKWGCPTTKHQNWSLASYHDHYSQWSPSHTPGSFGPDDSRTARQI